MFCKILHLEPRHQEIVARILGEPVSAPVTILIGVMEVLMCAWILTGIRPRFCAVTQAVLIAAMNLIEYFRAADLLLFGKLNIVFAFLFILFLLLYAFNRPPGYVYPLAGIRDHPFPVETRFKTSLVLTWALPAVQLKPLLPEHLEPDTLDDQTGFVAVALVDTRGLRPKGFPAWMGNDFILAGYRIFVRYTSREGKRLRGLYILGSGTNKRKMTWLGGIFTRYRYSYSPIRFMRSPGQLMIESPKEQLKIEVDLKKEAALPTGSPFRDWKEARRFAGPLPFTFSWLADNKEMLIVEGVRSNWEPRPVEVTHATAGLLQQPALKGAVLANAFIIEDIPYYWKKGKKEKWGPQ